MKFFLILSLPLFFFSPNSHSQNLKKIFEQAKNYSAQMKDKSLAIEVAEQKKSQAYSTVLPSLTANSDNVWRDQVNVGAFGEGYQRTSYLTLSQPLFQGGAEYYAVKIAKDLPVIAKFERQASELNLYEEVAKRFFEVLRLRRQQKTYDEQISTLVQRLKTLRSRARIGRNKKTDVLAAESQLARVRAEAVWVQSQLVSAENSLFHLTGEKNQSLEDSEVISSLTVPESWGAQLSEVPKIKSAEAILENTRRKKGIATGEYLPKVDLDANYYLDRSGILQDSDWDVTVSAQWNLFAGGTDKAERRIQALESQRLEAYLVEQKKHIKTDYESLKTQFLVQKMMIEKLQSAVSLAEKNYKQHIRESNQGLVSQLDVLRVLEDFLQVRRNYDQEFYNVKLTWVKLQVLAGVLP